MAGRDTSSGSIYAPPSFRNVVRAARNLPTEPTPAPKITALVMQRHQFKLEYFLSVNSRYKVFVGIPGFKSNILGTKWHGIYSLRCFRDLQINFTTLYKHLSVKPFWK